MVRLQSLPLVVTSTSFFISSILQANINFVGGIDASKLGLSQATPKEVCETGYRTYRQYVLHNEHKLILQSPTFQQNGLIFRENKGQRAIIVPIDPWLRSQFNVLENFIKEKVTIPDEVLQVVGEAKYKPLWDRERMCISVSQWCAYFRDNGDGAFEQIPANSHFGDGTYNVSVEVPYVYIGPHKDGYSFSLTLRIVQVVYKPTLRLLAPSENQIVCHSTPPPPTPTVALTATQTATKAKRGRKRKADVLQVLADIECENSV